MRAVSAGEERCPRTQKERRGLTVEEDAVMKANQSYADEYREIAGGFTRLVEGVPDRSTWDKPAPPEGWVARDVVRHLVEWFPSFLEDGAGIVLPTGPDVDADPVQAWRTFSDGVQAVLDDPANGERTFSHRHTGELPLPVAISRFFTADVFMHTWDLARATGQDETLDPERCALMLEGMEPLEELIRSSGQYGPRVPVSDDASSQEKLLAFIGRDPRHENGERSADTLGA
jgi:uncharacterized protein (TIGR03086 family)